MSKLQIVKEGIVCKSTFFLNLFQSCSIYSSLHKDSFGAWNVFPNIYQNAYPKQIKKTNQPPNILILRLFRITFYSKLDEQGFFDWLQYIDYVTENFLIEDLLCHRSGLGLGAGDLMFFTNGSNFTIKDVVTSFQYFKPVSAFRTQFDYDNLLYFVAGEITAKVSGMSWEQFIQTRIMKPLQMNNSFASVKEIDEKTNIAMPHSTEGSENGKMKTFALFEEMVNGAAGGILSNVDDMSKWMIMHLNKGKYGEKLDKQLFSESRQKEMWQIYTVYEANPNPRYNSHFAGYGLGWSLSDMKGNLSVSHTGGLPGMLSIVSLVPDMNLGIVILTNTGAPLFRAVHNSIIDSYLGTGFQATHFSKAMEIVNEMIKNKVSNIPFKKLLFGITPSQVAARLGVVGAGATALAEANPYLVSDFSVYIFSLHDY
jgi:CubicO group peptidase (beta-lactamase class C family)